LKTDQRVTARIVVEEPGGKANRRVLDCVELLPKVRHLVRVAHVVLVEEVQLLAGGSLTGAKRRMNDAFGLSTYSIASSSGGASLDGSEPIA
jgi:hypothetical protein